jgi:hypothetical protein
MRAARLATLVLLFCQVGQETISIFIVFSNLLVEPQPNAAGLAASEER